MKTVKEINDESIAQTGYPLMVNQYPEPTDLESAFLIVRAMVHEFDGHDDETWRAWNIVVSELSKNNKFVG